MFKGKGAPRKSSAGGKSEGKRTGGKSSDGGFKKSGFGNSAGSGKKTYGGKSKPYGSRETAPKKSYGDSDDTFRSEKGFSGERDTRPPFKKSYGKSEGGFKSEKRGFGERDTKPGFKKSYGKSDDGFRSEKRSSGDKDFQPGFKKSYGKTDDSFKSERKTFGERDSKPGFKKNFDSDERPRKSYGEKSSSESRERKPYASKGEGFKKSYGDEKPPRKSFGEKSSERSGRKPYTPKGPGFKKSYGDSPRGEKKSYGGRTERNYNDDAEYIDNGTDDKPKEKRFTGKSPFKKKKEHKEGSDDGSIRLNRYLASAGVGSRREADKLIETGAVKVNGKIVTEMGTKVFHNDKVEFGGERVRSEVMRYILLNKPKDFITTTDDPQNRRTVLDLVRDACTERVFPVGRLDRNTTGLLLITNDGALAKKLTHPSHQIKKIYHVELDRNLTAAELQQINSGIKLEDGLIKVDQAVYVDGAKTKKEIGVEIHSGRNRIVRRIFESLGHNVVKLDRVYFGGLTKKNLPKGRWRFLTEMELNMLKML